MSNVNVNINAKNQTGGAFRAFSNTLKKTETQVRSFGNANRSIMRGMTSNRRIVQQFGMQFSDIGVQIAGGQSALLSLTQQVPQIVQMFGAFGGVLATVITFVGLLSLTIVKSGKSIRDVADSFGATATVAHSFVDAMMAVKDGVLVAVNFIINNLDLLATTLATLAVALVLRIPAAFVISGKAASFFTRELRVLNLALVATNRKGLAAGLSILRMSGMFAAATAAVRLFGRALRMLGITALIMAIGWLGERMFTVISATGGLGEAFSLLGEVARDVFRRMPTYAEIAAKRIQIAFAESLTSVSDNLAGILSPQLYAVVKAASSAASASLAETRKELEALTASVSEPTDAMLRLKEALEFGKGTFDIRKLTKPTGEVDVLGDSGQRLREMASSMQSLEQIGSRLTEGRLRSENRLIELAEYRLAREIEGIEEAGRKAVEAGNDRAAVDQMMIRARRDAEIATEIEINDIRRRNLDEYNQKMSEIVKAIREDNRRKIVHYESTRTEFSRAFSDGLEDAVRTGNWKKSLLSALNNIFTSVLNDIGRRIGGSIFDSIFGGGQGNNFFKSIFGGARASGGPVSAGKAYLVGEKGPELMVPGRSGVIVPNAGNGLRKTFDGGPSGAFHITVDTSPLLEVKIADMSREQAVSVTSQAFASVAADEKVRNMRGRYRY